MIVSLIIGKHKSEGVPGKNYMDILGRPMVEYAFLAAEQSDVVEETFVSTDSPDIKKIGRHYDANIIDRPSELATPDALTEEALSHAFGVMEERTDERIEIVSLHFANAPHIKPELIDEAVDILGNDDDLDSVVSVSRYNMFTPLRARRVTDDGIVEPYVDPEALGGRHELNSIRGAAGDCYYEDFAIQVLRRRCLANIENGELPFKWMGKRSYAVENEFGFDVDAEWQLPVIEKWLRDRGFTESGTPYDIT